MSLTHEQERLSTYYPFDVDVIERVAEVAELQRASSWRAISGDLPEIKRFGPEQGNPIDVLDIIPDGGFDGVFVYHNPMSIPVDENIAMRMATLSAANPAKRIIAVGSPGSPGHTSGRLRSIELAAVWSGNLRPTVGPALQYLGKQGIEHSTQIGFSYGADKAAASAQFADRYDQSVHEGVFMEPASVQARGLIKLVRAFMGTGAATESYVQAAACSPLIEARHLAGKLAHGFPGYLLGLMRASNIAVANALSKDGFEARVRQGLRLNNSDPHHMEAHIVWGTESELATHGLTLGVTKRLQSEFGEGRVTTMAIEGGRHAMGDDIFLHTALILQALR